MSTNFEARFCDSGWSEEYDCVPLRLRSKMLHSKQGRVRVDAAAGVDVSIADDKPVCQNIVMDKKENVDCNDKIIQTAKQPSSVIFAKSPGLLNHGSSDCGPQGPQLSSLDNVSKNSVDYPEETDLERTSKGPASEAVSEEKTKNVADEFANQAFSEVADIIPIDFSVGSESVHVQSCKLNHQTVYGFDDDLDDVVLGERKRMLKSRNLTQSSGSCIEEHKKYKEMPISSKPANRTVGIVKQESNVNQYTGIAEMSNPLSSPCDHLDSNSRSEEISYGKSLPLPFELGASPTAAETNTTFGSTLLSLAKVKEEHVDTSGSYNEANNDRQNFITNSRMLCVKSEDSFFDSVGDELDHLPLIDRVKLISSGALEPNTDTLDNLESHKDNVESISISRPLKRRKTATNSVETALEEDAPGLLKVLIERGILVDEMKLYGEEDSDGDSDDLPGDDSFSELEAVMSQLCFDRQTFLKFPLLHTKGTRISYCLASLLSLVEQTRFLRDRKWPVEWGWCRDLQSFIFVFQRHNRIVLERPEYGYATYFFELLNSVPVSWQIKRLVTALKLTSCGRITLIENKPLVVGEDLSEGEARVLAEYGWTPNTGLGSMLNYCDRVVHDRKNEMNSSEWRSKIGKQLMNGYNGGTIVSIGRSQD